MTFLLRGKPPPHLNEKLFLHTLPKEVFPMLAIHNGQCGLCTHFGETHKKNDKLVAILTSHQAPESLIDECGHPRLVSLHLKVTPASGCDGFTPAAQA